MKLKIYAAGGTIDKIYFDAKSEYQVGEPTIIEILAASNVTIEYDCEILQCSVRLYPTGCLMGVFSTEDLITPYRV